jgi:drug/metabolite transporter (DMT)-like permease
MSDPYKEKVMKVPAAYLAVVLIWSTTPLGIVWSSESVHPMMALLMRMSLAVTLGLMIIKLANVHFPWHATARRLYRYSAIGIFGGMAFAYLSTSYLPSGTISLCFGLTPLLSGVLSQKILNTPPLSHPRKMALLVAFSSLGVVFWDSLSLNSDIALGYVYVLLGVFFFSTSGVMVKSVSLTIHPIATTVGALLVSMPLFILSWYFVDGTFPIDQWQARSLWAIAYLGIFGSLIGFISYFYILQKLSASTVAMTTLMTPVIALTLGALLNNEAITTNLIIGTVGVLSGLALYNWGDKFFGYITDNSA